MSNMALRTCKICGRKAYTQEDLESFMLNWSGKYKRNNICNKCFNKYQREMKIKRENKLEL